MTGYLSCVPRHIDSRSFTLREDFCIITGNIITAAALGVAEIKTNEIIDNLRSMGSIPEHELPPKENLWFDLSLREVEFITLGIRSKSTYAHSLSWENKSGSSSLIQLGFLDGRIIARLPQHARAKFQTRLHGRRQYIVVEDVEGRYKDQNGIIHNAIEEGFIEISKQYLLLIDHVNAAIAALR